MPSHLGEIKNAKRGEGYAFGGPACLPARAASGGGQVVVVVGSVIWEKGNNYCYASDSINESINN